jgi:hypothetical protein
MSDFNSDLFNLSLGRPPVAISDFLYEVFDLCDVRGRVGEFKNIEFRIYTKETCHTIPHVHAEYNGHTISIAITNGAVLCGNLPPKQELFARKWVLDNKEKLLSIWKNIAISQPIPLNKSKLDS